MSEIIQKPMPQTEAAPPSSTQAAMVMLRGIVLKFGNNTVLDGIDLTVNRNEIVAVVGPSGTGKSTLVKIIAGLLIPDEGEVVLQSDRISLAFQTGALFSSMTVAENIALALERTTDLDNDEIEKRIDRYLSLVGLRDKRDQMPTDLSGGMQKRVGIARALAIQPDIMLYDEPSAGLDPILGQKLEESLREINKELQMATIVVTHEMPTIENLADRVVMLYQGKFVYQGSKDDFMTTREPYAYQFRTRREAGPIEVQGGA
jgi:phospholipid/cholesterol/gamma-HCH transport system ATP-binding protein